MWMKVAIILHPHYKRKKMKNEEHDKTSIDEEEEFVSEDVEWRRKNKKVQEGIKGWMAKWFDFHPIQGPADIRKSEPIKINLILSTEEEVIQLRIKKEGPHPKIVWRL
ncbi:butyrate kinase [Sesbania bispinosa]|nr:butyrate kinase [Sesbania bispinosa]